MAKRDKTNYIAYADIARIMAAFAVVLLHVAGARLIIEDIGSVNFFRAAVFDCAMRWSVPLFIMLSGMLFLNKNKKLNIRVLYTKNILRLVTAFLFWSLVYNMYTSYLEYRHIGVAFFEALKNVHNGAMHLWFIFVIIGLYIVMPFIKRMCENMTKREAECFILLSMLVTFLPKTLSSFDIFAPFIQYIGKFEINYTAGYVGLFVAGWYIDRFEHSKKEKSIAYLMGLAGFLYMLTATVYFSIKRGVIADEFMSFKSLSAFLMAIAVMMMCKSVFSKKNFSRRAKSDLAFYSKYTFGVYLIHEMFLNISAGKGWFLLPDMPYIGIVLEAVIIFAISMIATGIISIFPFGKYIS
ncbi:MAG: acyltransferase family protein [Clostridia bacterium]|nr:acyltransferase family protein [Clostridia bacterium]